VNHRSQRRPGRASIAAALVILALATVAVSGQLELTEARQPGAVIDVGGQLLTSTEYKGLVTVGEGVVHPYEMHGNGLVLRPGYIAITQLKHLGPTVGVELAEAPGLSNRLHGNHPNPFNPSTTIRFSLAQSGYASLKIYDVRGRMIRSLVDDTMPAGDHEIRWDGRTEDGSRAASGVYFMRLAAPGFSEQSKLVLAR
jgi:hypothetical protein